MCSFLRRELKYGCRRFCSSEVNVLWVMFSYMVSTLQYGFRTSEDSDVFVLPQLEKKEMTPPFKPQITDDYGLENFDTQFTNEPVQLTPDDA